MPESASELAQLLNDLSQEVADAILQTYKLDELNADRQKLAEILHIIEALRRDAQASEDAAANAATSQKFIDALVALSEILDRQRRHLKYAGLSENFERRADAFFRHADSRVLRDMELALIRAAEKHGDAGLPPEVLENLDADLVIAIGIARLLRTATHNGSGFKIDLLLERGNEEGIKQTTRILIEARKEDPKRIKGKGRPWLEGGAKVARGLATVSCDVGMGYVLVSSGGLVLLPELGITVKGALVASTLSGVFLTIEGVGKLLGR